MSKGVTMTPEEIDAMPAGPEMDALIECEIFRRAIIRRSDIEATARAVWRDQPDCRYFAEGFEAWMQDGQLRYRLTLRPYSTSDAAALEVVKATSAGNTVWSIRQWTPSYCEASRREDGSVSRGWGGVFAEAICRAALKATL